MSDLSHQTAPADWPGVESPADTKPKRPAGFPVATPDSSWSEPLDTSHLLPPEDEQAPGRCLLNLVVIGATSFLCLVILMLSAVAGYRDEVKAIRTSDAHALGQTVEAQYNLARQDEMSGRILIARDRYVWIQTRQPGFQDVPHRLDEINRALSHTLTPQPTYTPTTEPPPVSTPTTTEQPVLAYFREAQQSFTLSRYEEAIEWLRVVLAEDPTYNTIEVNQMLFTALTRQADIYFKGLNPVDEEGQMGYPGNMLARGVLLTDEAIELKTRYPTIGNWPEGLIYTQGFVRRYLLAKGYLDSGDNSRALAVLEGLCAENCGWSYRGETVESLLNRARGAQ